MNNPPKLLIDSNVWVDSYLEHRSHHADSLEFLREAHRKQATLLYGATKLETIYYILARQMRKLARNGGREVDAKVSRACDVFAWGCVENIRELACAIGADEADIWLASKYRSVSNDFEDNMLLAAAQRSQADYLVTWDNKLLATPITRTATPTQMIALLQMD